MPSSEEDRDAAKNQIDHLHRPRDHGVGGCAGFGSALTPAPVDRATDPNGDRATYPVAGMAAAIYAVTHTGHLIWYAHEGYEDGSESWRYGGRPIKIGTGFNNFKRLFPGKSGVIYAVTDTGDLIWYRHEGWRDGANKWTYRGAPKKIGTGFGSFKHLFASSP